MMSAVRLGSFTGLVVSTCAAFGQEVAFEKIVLCDDAYYCDGVATGDFNRDGAVDIVAGPFWYEGPKFRRRHEIYPPVTFDPAKGQSDSLFSNVYDFNGDGRPEIVTHWEGSWGYVAPNWNRPHEPWTFHPLGAKGDWPQFHHGQGVGDLTGDGLPEIVINEGWLTQERSRAAEGEPAWRFQLHRFAKQRGGAQMLVYDVDGDEDADVVTSLDSHGWGLAWFENTQDKETGKLSFVQHTIMGSREEEAKYGVAFSQPHALVAGDIDGDGLTDVVVGKRRWAHGPKGDIEPGAPAVVYWFRLERTEDGVRFRPYRIDDNSGVGLQIAATDVNADGRLDVLTASKLGTSLFLAKPQDHAADSAAEVPTVEQLIQQAGNADEDAARLKILRQLKTRPDLDETLRADVDRVVAVVDRWVNDPRLFQWFHKEIRETLDYDFGIAKESPLYPLTCIYRGRMLVWTANEYGNIKGYHEVRRRFFDRAVGHFRTAAESFPDNRIVRMYLGEPIPPTKPYPGVAGAPAWAVAQREGLERLSDIVLWWIDHRLQEDGQYGGGWDDDCEMWRHWVPVMIAFEHPRMTEAQEFFSRALLSQEYMQGGYTRRIYDVEHTAEPTSDTITPMMHLAPEDPQWRKRAMLLAELMETVWTDQNECGLLQFKSTYFSSGRVDDDPVRACDTPYHIRAMEPALVLWLRTGDKRLGQLFTAWMDTWVDATARAERGKQAGVIPAAIRWPGGEPAGPGPQWWDPRHHGEPRLYEWPSAVQKLTDALLLTYHMTDDDKYLQPLRSMAAIRLEALTMSSREMPQPGSRQWCGTKLGFLARTLAKYRLLTGSDEFDELLAQDGPTRFVDASDPDRVRLTESLRHTAEALAINFPGRTSEVRWTDRVFAFARLFGEDMLFADRVPACDKRPNLGLLYATATGDRGDFAVFPLNSVRWLTEPRKIAAMVTERGSDRFSAELFHFGVEPRSMGAELYLLKPGRYTFALVDEANSTIGDATPFTVDGPRTRIAFELPPQTLCRLHVTAK